MLTIHKLRDDMTIDFAALELKKYLRMMMPNENVITIASGDGEGFRLGKGCGPQHRGEDHGQDQHQRKFFHV